MSCAVCATSVENRLKNHKGVISATVNFAAENVNVLYEPNIVSERDLQQAVRDIGYDLWLDEPTQNNQTLDQIHQQKWNDLKKRTIVAIILTLPIVLINMFLMHKPFANYLMCLLATPVVFWIGKDFFSNAIKQAKHGSSSMDTLVALSTGVAYLFSLFNTFFPQYWLAKGLASPIYFEAAAVVITFILIGKLLEEKAKGNTSSALQKLMGLQPKKVTIKTNNGQFEEIDLANVQKGMTILVKPGEQIAVDGRIIQGNSYIDESLLTGEPIAVFKQVNDPLFAGTINQKGSLQFEAEKVGAQTLLAQIIQAVQQAQGSKAPIQQLADKIAARFVPIVMAIALLAFIVWNVCDANNGFTQGLLALVTVLVIACPCALGLATPTAIMVGIGKAAEQGILIKDAESLEVAQSVNAIVLDKTGTLTQGKPTVQHIAWLPDSEPIDQNILANIERLSEHPLADAIVAHLNNNNSTTIDQFESISGQGAKGMVKNKTYYVGNLALLTENNIDIAPTLTQKAQTWLKEAYTLVYFANEQQCLAIIALSDPIKPTTATAIQQLKKANISVYMLTGDNEQTAQAIAHKLAIDHYKAQILPQEKANFIKQLQQQGKIVAMVGDGINDSTALAQANVGIAMGKGSDIAMDVAKMTIISSDLQKLPILLQLSKDTVATIRQNLFWAFAYNVIGIPIAAGILYPINGFLLNPMWAGAAMALSSVSVVANSLRLKWS